MTFQLYYYPKRIESVLPMAHLGHHYCAICGNYKKSQNFKMS